ncbi:hypothetical protein GDO81_010272 [Engystomops pustulosus]|uniref:RNA polymerase II-associated protein 3 n=1 Tax=Engystomops pustulosus TaxID=76066 RepID=A0AAV7BYE5_ENGPU|nr:hypothetical protein GDO81_010272 [Engystomops pustulosus]
MSSPSKALELQLQMKQNAEELQDFMRELESWEKDIKKKDAKLSKQTADGEETLPPIRNKDYRKKKKSRSKVSTETKKNEENKNPKRKLHDYNYWDKLDVELQSCSTTSQEKEDLKEKIRRKTSDMVKKKEQHIEAQHLKQKAIGNAYFKEGKYELAIECYTEGIEADSTNALLPANRAMAYLKIQKYQEAEEDCTKAIALDTSYGKAFARRGTARIMLGKLSKAKEDFEMVLKLEPGNKQAISELAKISQELNEKTVNANQQHEEESKELEKRRFIKAVDKPPHLRSTKPLRRIEIEEIGGLLQTPDVFIESNDAGKVSVKLEDQAKGQEDMNSEELVTTYPDAPSAKMLRIEEISDLPATGELPGVPANSFQLEADLRRLKGNPDMLYTYLKQIEPSLYFKLFQKALDPDVFYEIIKILRLKYIENEEAELVLEILKTLSELRRFDMAIMFLSGSEKEDVRALFAYIENSKKTNDTYIPLKKKYGL